MNLENGQVVCGCFNVTVEDLKNAINNGDKSFEEIQQTTSVGKGCGKCVEHVKEVILHLQK